MEDQHASADTAVVPQSQHVEEPLPGQEPQKVQSPPSLRSAVCQYCGCRLGPSFVLCRACRTPHHLDCFSENGVCTTFACGCNEWEEYGTGRVGQGNKDAPKVVSWRNEHEYRWVRPVTIVVYVFVFVFSLWTITKSIEYLYLFAVIAMGAACFPRKPLPAQVTIDDKRALIILPAAEVAFEDIRAFGLQDDEDNKQESELVVMYQTDGSTAALYRSDSFDKTKELATLLAGLVEVPCIDETGEEQQVSYPAKAIAGTAALHSDGGAPQLPARSPYASRYVHSSYDERQWHIELLPRRSFGQPSFYKVLTSAVTTLVCVALAVFIDFGDVGVPVALALFAAVSALWLHSRVCDWLYQRENIEIRPEGMLLHASNRVHRISELPFDEIEQVEVRTADEVTIFEAPHLVVKTKSLAFELGHGLPAQDLAWLAEVFEGYCGKKALPAHAAD